MDKFFKFKNFKLWYLIALEFLKRYKLVISGVLLVITLALFAQAKLELFYHPNSITIGLIGTYQEHDLPSEVTELISGSLVKPGKDGKIEGELASGWEVNADATIFKFKLKDGLKWVDGSAIKSKDIDFVIPNVEISYPDDKTIQFKLKEPYSPLPSLLTKPLIKRGTLLGTGPYRIVILEKSRIFITKIDLKSKSTDLPTVSFRFYPQESVAITGFNLGEVQALLDLTNTQAFSRNSKIKFKQRTDYTKIVSIFFNTQDSNLSSRSLRQALSFTAPKIEGEEVANNPYPPFLWAYDPDSKKYLSNKDQAQAALKRAKATISEEKLKGEIILTSTTNLKEVAEKIVASWRELGLNAKVRIEEGIAQNFQALLITQSIPPDPDQYFLWHATQTRTNLTKYDSKRADKDLEDGRRLIDEQARKEKYLDFQKTLLEDTPAVFLYFPKYNIAYQKKKEAALDKVLSLTN